MPSPRPAVVVGGIADKSAQLDHLLAAGAIVILAPSVDAARELVGGSTRDAADDSTAGRPPWLQDLSIDLRERRASWKGCVLELSQRELVMLGALATAPGKAFSFAELASEIGADYFGDPEPIRSAVKRLRRKVANEADELEIESVRGYGFRLRLRESHE